ncbi:MAG TPA: ribosome maturation factor RimP [Coriobacteriia bacterium]|nr:ribosome maturation factor RimP [Coriobacteriia bacterium]
MAKTDIARTLEELLEPVAAAHGLELVAVEQAGGRKSMILRVLLDCEGGISLDAICEANAWINDAIDEADLIGGPYTLEVSSPGIDRPLRKPSDFERFAGETVTVKKTARPGEGRLAWTGVLVGLEGESVVLDVDGERVEIALDSVQKARLKGVVDFSRERGADQ